MRISRRCTSTSCRRPRPDFSRPSGLTSATGRERALEEDLIELREAHGASLLVSLVGDGELEHLGIESFEARVRACGLDLVRFPIADFSTPNALSELEAVVAEIVARARGGETVVIHCWAGLGRTGLVVACCLVLLGRAPEEAIAIVRRHRPGAVEDSDQEECVAELAAVVRARPPAPWPPLATRDGVSIPIRLTFRDGRWLLARVARAPRRGEVLRVKIDGTESFLFVEQLALTRPYGYPGMALSVAP